MDEGNRYTRSKHMDNRKDLVIWERFNNNISTLKSLRVENDAYLLAVREFKTKMDETTESKLSNKRIREKIQELREDIKIIEIMRDRDDYKIGSISTQKRTINHKEQAIKHEKPFSKSRKTVPQAIGFIPNGSKVVAKMVDSDDPNQEWILANVIHYYPEKNRYQIEDAEVDDDGQKTKYILPTKYVIPLETKELNHEFPVGHEVLALYPNTTCFYKATVKALPSQNRSKGHHLNHYMVLFEDDDDTERWVEKNMVLDMPNIV
ncbi:DUF1325-domain-containing protein [Neoconidiobolus thromboides FSU 785]|nr:DUF1325-domain-containing protein [Neoconidiobolus thromboides FSU 785]